MTDSKSFVQNFTVLGPAGAPMRTPWGSFAGKPLSQGDHKSFVQQFTVLGPAGAPMRVPWGSFAGKTPALVASQMMRSWLLAAWPGPH
jgi:hypothetical protein